MATMGGAYNSGTVFSIGTDGSGYKDLLDFSGTNGALPQGSLILSGSTLYGMTEEGGANDLGTIFSVDTDGGSYTDLLDFTGANGRQPYGDLTLDGSTLFGMTSAGGAYGEGTVFSLQLAPTPEPSTFALLCIGAVGLLGWASRRNHQRAGTLAVYMGLEFVKR
jgi:uncharacterized repeat protein (TIGR03803 family)